MKYINKSTAPFSMVIRLTPSVASNKEFTCAPGATMEGPDGYADVFAGYGLVPAGADVKPAEPPAVVEGTIAVEDVVPAAPDVVTSAPAPAAKKAKL